ncbi:hypothetical protein ABH926_008936 [Catenulispora sp. GP43]|uniref:hypothetical protein n=1 Tax=Catenulispora sp. GP43 TaxID=3156263 RepID=UPI0035190EA9
MNPPSLPAIDVIGAVAVFTLCNLGVAWLRPFKTCRRCNGYGKTARRSGHGRPRPCRRCHGHGVRLRYSRRLLNVARAHFRNADLHPADRGPVLADTELDATLADAHSKHLAAITARLDLDGAWRSVMARVSAGRNGGR